MQQTVDLKGRVVVVTGAARGMGRAYVEALLKQGARVVATDLHWRGSEEFRQRLASTDVLSGDMDISDDGQIDAVYQATLERFGTVDVLLNNAGMRQRDLFPPSGRTTTLETRDADYLRMFSVNTFGTLKVTRKFIQPMIEKRRGSVINICSNGVLLVPAGDGVWRALRPNSGEQPYQAAKSALMNWSLYMAEEIKQYNVAVNVVFPGHTRTTGSDEQEAARRAQGRQGGPIPLEPEHVVPLVLHLAQQDGNGETGNVYEAVRWNELHGFGGADVWRQVTPTA